jgi:hypothetical protein
MIEGIAERLQRLHQDEAASREVVWSGAGVVTHEAARDFPVAGARISDSQSST